MKKITAFFMALMPLLITILLFAAGLIVKNATHVYVSSVELPQQSVKILREDDTKEKTYPLQANVLPHNATNPKVKWTVSDDNVLSVDANGLVTCKNYGEAYVYATSDENPTLSDACKVDVYDTKIHSIEVANKYEASYIGLDQTQKINIKTVPSMSHIVNQTINYTVKSESPESGDESVIELTKDGLILPKAKGKAIIEITSDDPESKAITSLEVNVGLGVNTMCLDNPNKEIIANSSYNLFDHIITAPEKINRDTSVLNDASKITATDFTYTSSDETIATVDEKGQVEFNLPGLVTFTIAYKRNPELKVNKTIESTCDQLKQVYFSGNNFEVALDDDLNSKINWFVYPYSGTPDKTKEQAGVEITSSDENVVSVTSINGQPKLTIEGTGSVVLTASIKTSEDTYRTDSCLVKVLLPSNYIKEGEVKIDSCYYPLINNIKIPANQQYKGDLKFELDYESSNVATLEESNILHFKNPNATAKINVTAITRPGQEVSGSFTVKCEVPKTSVIKLDVADKVVIEVGKRYEFNGATPVWTNLLFKKGYAKDFDYTYDGNQFSAFMGDHIDGEGSEPFELKLADGTTKYIDLIIVEKPLYISSDTDTYYSSSAKTVYFNNRMFDEVNATVFPTTARKADGSTYELIKEYDPSYEQIATIDSDVISFNQAGTVFATASTKVDDQITLSQSFGINSTFGDTVGKFEVKSAAKSYNSYDTINLDPSTEATKSITLLCDKLTEDTYDQMTVESTTGLTLVENPKWVTDHAEIKITAQPTSYGRDVVAIKTKTYAVYLYVDVAPMITDIQLIRSGEVIDATKVTKTYTTNLKFRLQVLPAAKEVKPEDITVTFNGTESISLPVAADYSITLPAEEKWKSGTQETDINTLTISCSGFSKEYKLNYSKEVPNFKLEGTTENNLYFSSNSTQKECKIVTDGLVEDDWYEKNLKISFASTEQGEKFSFTRQYLSIYGIKLPEVEDYKPYQNTLYVQYGDSGTKLEYKMGRDYVSKITFPNHDNDDMTDKKGLQKIHVYGNHSFYKEDQKEVDYYLLPVELEDFNHQPIKNTEQNPEAVLTALSTLIPSFGNSKSHCEATNDGYIKIYFDNDDLYTLDQIKNDEFDSKTNKNVTFTLSTKSNEVKAKYTFVATEGVNQYCQEGLMASQDKRLSSVTSVLQTNFGMVEGTKNNEPLTDRNFSRLVNLIGNGYELNTDNLCKQVYQSSQWFGFQLCTGINVIIKGQEKKTMLTENAHSEFGINTDDSIPGDAWFRYSTIMDYTHASNISATKRDVYFNKCLFRENLTGVFFEDGANGNKFFLEDCIIFDTSSIVLVGMKSNLYIKGFLDIYNFHGQECLKNIPFVGDLSALWPIIENIGRQKDMLNRGADGRSYVNTFAAVALSKIYFYNHATGQYEESEHGLPGSCEHLSKFASIKIPGTDLNAAFWATPNADTHQGAPSYYDEFDKDGNIRLDFLYNQIIKITREIHYF